MKLSRFSAYQGGSWKSRRLSHEQECGSLWTPSGANSEYQELKEVLLYQPPKSPPKLRSPERIQHLRPIDWKILKRELALLSAVLKKNGVRVHPLKAEAFDDFKPNLMFARDLFFMTPWGAVLGRMASSVRAGEEKWAQLALSQLGIPLVCMIRGHGTFEGADALWLSPKKVLVGLGNRTNAEGFRQLKNFLAEFGVKALAIRLPKKVQHLLGLLQIVSPCQALLRIEICPPRMKRLLEASGFQVIGVKESVEVVELQAMNVLTLQPGLVLMPSDCPDFRELLLRNRIVVRAEVPISQLLNAAGGIACTVHPLRRNLLRVSQVR